MFGFKIDKKYLYIIIGILVAKQLVEYSTQEGALLGLLLSVPGLLIAITFHEFAHAFIAVKLGDDTPKFQGRLTLNPIAHLDPVGCFLLLFAGFGWGKPVVVNPRNYNRKFSMEKADALVSIAGPIMNFILAIIFTILNAVMIKFNYFGISNLNVAVIILAVIQYTILINVGLGIFNLIPLPPLDGSKVIKPLLPYNAKEWFEKNEMIFYIIFLVIWFTGFAGTIISPIISGIGNGLIRLGEIIFL